MYAVTLHQPGATLVALGVKSVRIRSWPAPERLLGQVFAVQTGKRIGNGATIG